MGWGGQENIVSHGLFYFPKENYATVIMVHFPVHLCYGYIQFLYLYLYVFSELWFISWYYEAFHFVGNCLCLGKYVIYLS